MRWRRSNGSRLPVCGRRTASQPKRSVHVHVTRRMDGSSAIAEVKLRNPAGPLG